MPPPISIPGHRRKVWDRKQVEAACSKLAGVSATAPAPTEEPNPWDVVLQ